MAKRVQLTATGTTRKNWSSRKMEDLTPAEIKTLKTILTRIRWRPILNDLTEKEQQLIGKILNEEPFKVR
jgi:hypothetical protein